MRILVYLDPTPRGAWATGLAGQLPLRADWTLLATADDTASRPALLAEAGAGFAGTVSRVTRPGPAERAVAEEARTVAYDLLVVPPAGRGALARMLKGSRVASVVRSVRAPVLVARRPPPRVARILAGLSGGQGDMAVARAAASLGRALTAETTFLHVASEVVVPMGGAGSEPSQGPVTAARAAAEAAGGTLALREGLVVEELLEAFERGAHDVLVIGAAADEPGFGREDTTERLLLGCGGSVLVVPRAGLVLE